MSETTLPAEGTTPPPAESTNTSPPPAGQGNEAPTPPAGEGSSSSAPQAGSEPPAPQDGTTGNQQLSPVEAERLKRENQRLRNERNAAREEADKVKRDQMTDEERARHDSEAAQAALAQANQRLVSAAVIAEAARLGFADPSDAVAFVDKAQVVIGDDGNVTGAAEAVKALVEAKPHLVNKPSGNAGNVFQPAGGNQAPPKDESDRDRLLRLKLANPRPVAGQPRIRFDRQRVVEHKSNTPPQD